MPIFNKMLYSNCKKTFMKCFTASDSGAILARAISFKLNNMHSGCFFCTCDKNRLYLTQILINFYL